MVQYYCYLLKSEEKTTSTRCYIGFSTDPVRRLRQHNGEIANGARKTSVHRPWRHVCIISGFPNKLVALQFEWTLQHPTRSRVLRREDCAVTGSAVKSKLKQIALLLHVRLWRQLDLKIHFLDASLCDYYRQQTLHILNPVFIERVDEFQQRVVTTHTHTHTALTTCVVCDQAITSVCWKCGNCCSNHHLVCLSRGATHGELSIPPSGACSTCHKTTLWSEIVREALNPEIIQQQSDDSS